MKRLIGTVTLAFLEEDNRQRVLFRLIPLSTREGTLFEDAAQAFPDDGSLRIVPDKHEQSTFKDRMRSMSGYCAVVLPADGKEQMKVRQNRNYTPRNGERNQFALYSDVVFEFSPNSCYEVVLAGETAENALTNQVLLQNGKMLYGPVDKKLAASSDIAQLPVFGNESFLMQTFQNQIIGKRTVCWNPETVLNWRQRKAEQRRQEKAGSSAPSVQNHPVQGEKADKPASSAKKGTEKEKKTAEKTASASPKIKEKGKATVSQTVPDESHEEKADKTLPLNIVENSKEKNAQSQNTETQIPHEEESEILIGEHLEILDTTVSFEEQISSLSQPISENANRLTNDLPQMEEQEEPEPADENIPHFSGTPLTAVASKSIGKSFSTENAPGVVDKQLRGYSDSLLGDQYGKGLYEMVDHPLETLGSTLDFICQNSELRNSAIQLIARNHSFCSELMKAFRHSGIVEETEAAALEQLDEIEAERISLLMQLKHAKEDARKYREEALLSVGQKKRAQLTELDHHIRTSEETKNRLEKLNHSLSTEMNGKLHQFLQNNLQEIFAANDNCIQLSPIIGEEVPTDSIVDRVRIMLNHHGYSVSDDEAAALVVTFSLCDRLYLKAPSFEDAERFAAALTESLGLNCNTAVLHGNQQLQLISLLKNTDSRTPTVSVQPDSIPYISAYGHKTIFVLDREASFTLTDTSIPVINIPSLSKHPSEAVIDELTPIALHSFENISSVNSQLPPDSEKWVKHLLNTLSSEGLILSDSAAAKFRHFIATGSKTMHGSFISTADFAVAMWIVPLLSAKSISEEMQDLMTGFTHSLKLLHLD